MKTFNRVFLTLVTVLQGSLGLAESTLPLTAPKSLTYSEPNPWYTIHCPIEENRPTVTGGTPSSFVSSGLPTGLLLTPTGSIVGTPTIFTNGRAVDITAKNALGSITRRLSMTISPFPIESLGIAYPAGLFAVGVNNAVAPGLGATSLLPASCDRAKALVGINFSITPTLPSGLALNSTTGVISGIPTKVSAAKTYIITASNSSGQIKVPLDLIVVATMDLNATAPSNLKYSMANPNYVNLVPIPTNSPSNTGGVPLLYSLEGKLPLGLSFNQTTGKITGMPRFFHLYPNNGVSELMASAELKVTAINQVGKSETKMLISVRSFDFTQFDAYQQGAPDRKLYLYAYDYPNYGSIPGGTYFDFGYSSSPAASIAYANDYWRLQTQYANLVAVVPVSQVFAAPTMACFIPLSRQVMSGSQQQVITAGPANQFGYANLATFNESNIIGYACHQDNETTNILRSRHSLNTLVSLPGVQRMSDHLAKANIGRSVYRSFFLPWVEVIASQANAATGTAVGDLNGVYPLNPLGWGVSYTYGGFFRGHAYTYGLSQSLPQAPTTTLPFSRERFENMDGWIVNKGLFVAAYGTAVSASSAMPRLIPASVYTNWDGYTWPPPNATSVPIHTTPSIATVAGLSLEDAVIEATFSGFSTSLTGVVARYTGPAEKSLYVAGVSLLSTGVPSLAIWKKTPTGSYTRLGSAKVLTGNSITLRFEVSGSQLRLYSKSPGETEFTLSSSVEDSNPLKGTGVGIRGGQGAVFESFRL